MVKNILLGFTFLGLAVASAASSYNVTFYQPVMVNGSELICVSAGRAGAPCAAASGVCKNAAPNAIASRARKVFPGSIFRKRERERIRFMKLPYR